MTRLEVQGKDQHCIRYLVLSTCLAVKAAQKKSFISLQGCKNYEGSGDGHGQVSDHDDNYVV